MDYYLSLNYSELSHLVDQIYSTDTEIAMFTPYIELQIEIDSENRLRSER